MWPVPCACCSESSEPATAEEIAFAVRKLLEEAASERPLVVVLDDLHWAEPTFLDLIEHVADWSRDAPILLLCMARPELLDAVPAGRGGKLHATTVLVEPLGARGVRGAARRCSAPSSTRRCASKILASADGNPLFVEEMAAMVRDSPTADVQVPPTISALLSARLDQLAAPERAALACGSVEGSVFHRTAVDGARRRSRRQLMGLVRKELVRPDKGTLPGRRRVSVQAHPDPRRRVRGAAEGARARAARAVRGLARATCAGAGRARRDRRLPPRAIRRVSLRARNVDRGGASTARHVAPNGCSSRASVRSCVATFARARLYSGVDLRCYRTEHALSSGSGSWCCR